MSLQCAFGSFNLDRPEDRVAWQCLLDLLGSRSWVQLHSLDLAQCRLDPVRLRELATALSSGMASETLLMLDLTGNPLRDEGAMIVADIVRHTPLTSLALVSTGIGQHNCEELVKAVVASPTMANLEGLEGLPPVSLSGPVAAMLHQAGFREQSWQWVRY